MDSSSELIHALLPLYLVGVLGASTLTVGVIEGVAEATAAVTKVFSGALSDYLRERKWLTALGYGLAALSKPIFPLASDVAWVAAARFIDRVGKGIRGAPRDALIADLTPADLRGTAYGLRQSLDTVGAVLGPGAGDPVHGASRRQFHACILDRGDPGLHLGRHHRAVRARAEAGAGRAARALAAVARRVQAVERRLLAGGRRRRRVHAGALQRSLSALARASRSACR